MRPFALLFLIVFSLAARAAGLPPEVQKALRQAQIPLTGVAVTVQPVDGQQPLIEHNAGQAMNPASAMKLLTTYAALDLLGPAHTWKTTAWRETPPPREDAVDGTLNGNLYLKGSGDPRFAIEHLSSLLRQLRVRGLGRIAGDIVVDRSIFDVPAIDPGAFDDKPMRPYNVGPNGLLINFQALRFTLLAEPDQPRLLQETPSSGLRIDNQLRAVAGECGSDWKDKLTIRLKPENGGQRLEFSGPYPMACGEKTLNLSPLNAEAHAEGLIRALWQELGGTLDGRVRSGNTPNGATLLARHESAPLADVVRDINKFSNNVMARQLFLTLAKDAPKEVPLGDAPKAAGPRAQVPLGDATAPATAERARQRIANWLDGRGLRLPELQIENGSGLSRSERIGAGSLNRLLLDAWKHPAMPEFVASLPIAGIDGTMKKRLNGSPINGRAHIKTGSLDGVKSAAGYALDAQGRYYAVTFLINHPQAQAGGPAIDALLLWVANLNASPQP